MKPYYVAVKDGDDYRHLVERITCNQDLIDFKELVADLILEATEYFDEFRNMSSDDILYYHCFQIVKVPKKVYDALKDKAVAVVSMDEAYVTPIDSFK
jgi:hypothetical protein